ncbi:MAG: beta-N-acetylhexosaminidase [Nitrospirales bacterium]|nr:beta-N-acetylhexosaminidase [Nitrospira sp.]MDR4500761.1 beta-N-acetylhexosaminidase [Nitrospirales bacterium]
MSLRQQVGQLFMIGFDGTELSPGLISWIQEYQPGGIILFARNLVDAPQIARLTNALQALSASSPLLMAIDQEGGKVSRLPEGFTIFPPAATVAACGSSDYAYHTAAVTAEELRAVGFNMNMAPVLDVNTNPANPIIGDRAFSSTPEHVCTFGNATISGLHDHGVIACGKHFPGHGETTKDSHKELPVVALSKERLEQVELQPFRSAIAHGLMTMMSAHVHYPALDDTVPATLSYDIMTRLLREELGFSGVILSDDLEMNAIAEHTSMGDAAVRSVQAGVDVILICHQQSRQAEAIEAIEQAVSQGDISKDRLDQSLARISSLKQRFLHPYTPVDETKIADIVGRLKHQNLLAEIQSLSSSQKGQKA